MSSVQKTEKTRDEVLASVGRGVGKKFGDIFPAQVESNPGGTAVG